MIQFSSNNCFKKYFKETEAPTFWNDPFNLWLMKKFFFKNLMFQSLCGKRGRIEREEFLIWFQRRLTNIEEAKFWQKIKSLNTAVGEFIPISVSTCTYKSCLPIMCRKFVHLNSKFLKLNLQVHIYMFPF